MLDTDAEKAFGLIRDSVLFIGTQFSKLYIAVDTLSARKQIRSRFKRSGRPISAPAIAIYALSLEGL